MLLSQSEKLQFVGCKCLIALVRENIYYQRLLLKGNDNMSFIESSMNRRYENGADFRE
jgi:hypothetical protein